MSAGGSSSKNGSGAAPASSGHHRFSVQGRPKSPLVFEITGNNSIPENNPVNEKRKRKGASTVGLGLSDINQQFCSTMMGITFGPSTLQVCFFCVSQFKIYS